MIVTCRTGQKDRRGHLWEGPWAAPILDLIGAKIKFYDTEAHLSELDWLSPAKRHELVFAFNNTAANYPKHKTIHQLFEEQAERTPENVAVAFQDRTLSYRELNSRANQLAQHLQRLGSKPGVLVGLYLRHSTEMLVAL